MSSPVDSSGKFRTRSGLEIEAYYDAGPGCDSDTGEPGQPPFARGIDPELYRKSPWIMGQYSGYSSPQATNKRFKSLLEAGQTGFSVALDLPTQMGLDSDHERAAGEVGKVGVPINSLADLEELLEGVPLESVRQIRTSANSIGPILAAMFIALTEGRGMSPNSIRVMFQNDSLKEYIARGTFIFPPQYGLKLSVDVVEYCAKNIPRWEPIEFCGYHVRDSGCNAILEVAIALANGLEYVRETRRRGLRVNEFAGSLVLFLSADTDIFEEAAKFRAARRLWHRLLQEKFPEETTGIPGIGIFCYTLGGSLTAQEPENNIVRVAYQALAAALGGVQTLASSSFDEALGLPTDKAVQLSLRTQQILAAETGVTSVVDPLGGSYYVESLTDRLEVEIRQEIDKIENLGGAVAALDSGYLRDIITASAYAQQRALETGARRVVGMNYLVREAKEVGITSGLTVASHEPEVIERLRNLRASRDNDRVAESLRSVRQAATSNQNTMPSILEAVKAYATTGEICSTLADVWGNYVDSGRL